MNDGKTCKPVVKATKMRKNDKPMDARSSRNNVCHIFFIMFLSSCSLAMTLVYLHSYANACNRSNGLWDTDG